MSRNLQINVVFMQKLGFCIVLHACFHRAVSVKVIQVKSLLTTRSAFTNLGYSQTCMTGQVECQAWHALWNVPECMTLSLGLQISCCVCDIIRNCQLGANILVFLVDALGFWVLEWA